MCWKHANTMVMRLNAERGCNSAGYYKYVGYLQPLSFANLNIPGVRLSLKSNATVPISTN